MSKRMSTTTITYGAILTALVIILQFLGQFVRFGPFAISLVLLPIVIGAAKCGKAVGAWLGFVFGIAVFLSGDAALFLSVDVFGTIVTVLLKGVACGFAAAWVYKLLEKKNQFVAALAAAIVCPIVNTGVFLLGCLVFFMDTVAGWGAAAGFENVGQYMILGLVGVNFLFELGTNIVLNPIAIRILNLGKKK